MLPFHRAAVALRKAKSVVVCAHVRPDGDAVGSVLGMTLALRAAGIPAVPTLADDRDAPHTYEFLPGHSLYTRASDLEAPDAFVALDTPVPERLGVARPLMEAAKTVVLFDHHPDAQEYGTHCVCDASYAATGQIVWHFIPSLEIERVPEFALPLYVALLTDTGRFSYENTTPLAMRDAAEMLECGVDPGQASRLVFQERSRASLELEARALERLTVVNDGHVAWTYLEDADFTETGALPEEGEHLPDAVRVLGGIDVAVVLRQRGGEVRGNLRAKTGFDVGSVARRFNGGGHAAASGLTFQGTIAEFLPQLLAELPGGDKA